MGARNDNRREKFFGLPGLDLKGQRNGRLFRKNIGGEDIDWSGHRPLNRGRRSSEKRRAETGFWKIRCEEIFSREKKRTLYFSKKPFWVVIIQEFFLLDAALKTVREPKHCYISYIKDVSLTQFLPAFLMDDPRRPHPKFFFESHRSTLSMVPTILTRPYMNRWGIKNTCLYTQYTRFVQE